MSTLSFRPSSNGTGGNITFSFDTFSEDEVEVFVDGVLKTNGGSGTFDYNIPDYASTGGTITWVGTAPNSDNRIHIQRRTKILNTGGNAVQGKATFAAGSAVKATDLNNNTKQVLRAIQELQDQPVKRQDLEDGEVLRSKIAADAVDGTKIADDAVDSEHLAADSIDSEHYAPGSVDDTAIASNAVTTVKILNDNVTMEKLGSGALPTDITVSTDNIVNGTITTADIQTDQITNALIADDQIDSEHYVDGSIDNQHIADLTIQGGKIANKTISDTQIVTGTLDNRYYTETELDAGQLDNRYYTETELNPSANAGLNVLDARYFTETELNAGALDARYFTESEVEDNFLRQDSSETIASGVTWSSTDDKVATTAAIDLRIIELVDDVGGFVPIANETSFPTTNPDINTSGSAKGGTVVSVKTASTDLTPTPTLPALSVDDCIYSSQYHLPLDMAISLETGRHEAPPPVEYKLP